MVKVPLAGKDYSKVSDVCGGRLWLSKVRLQFCAAVVRAVGLMMMMSDFSLMREHVEDEEEGGHLGTEEQWRRCTDADELLATGPRKRLGRGWGEMIPDG